MSEKKEYIERGALIAFVREVRKKLPKDSKDFFTRDEMLLNFQQYLELQKAADVEPVVRGEWKEKTFECSRENWDVKYKCSACGRACYCISNYCPSCGAKMDGGATDET